MVPLFVFQFKEVLVAQNIENIVDTSVNRSVLAPVGQTTTSSNGLKKGTVSTDPIFKEEPATSYRTMGPADDGGTIFNPDTAPTMFQNQNPNLTTDQWGEPINTRQPPVEGGVQTPIEEPETPTTGGTTGSTSGSGSTNTGTRDPNVKATVEGILKDPFGFIKANGLEQKYTEQKIADDEIMDPTKYQVGPTGELVAKQVDAPTKVTADQAAIAIGKAADPVKVADFQAALIDPSSLTKAVDEIGKLDPVKAASMSKHLDGLLKDLETGNVPVWARPAVAKVEQMLAARGISASSIGRDSLFNAIIQSAMPIAQQDATFEQDAAKTNYNAKVQAVLSDVNMEFAAKQFNANSINQTNQFKAQLTAQVDLQNAARKDAMMQFNVSEVNKMSMFDTSNKLQADQFNVQMQQQSGQFNATQVNAMTQMTAQLQAQREQFNANMASQIEQSNVNWRRQVNTANTAGVNAVNQANVQNAFNLSNQALTFLWQEMRDKAHWDFQASESEKDRKNQLEAAILANEAAMGGEIGKFLEGITQGTKFLSSFLDSWK